MRLRLKYRPYTNRLTIDSHLVSELASRGASGLEVDMFQYPSDKWYVSIASHRGQFACATISEMNDEGSTWTLWLSEWLSDDAIHTIIDVVRDWQIENTMNNPTGEVDVRMKYETYITV